MRIVLFCVLLFCSAGNFAQVLKNNGFDNFGYGCGLLKFDHVAYSDVVITMESRTTKITFINDSVFEQRDQVTGEKKDFVRFGLVRKGVTYEFDTLKKAFKDSFLLPCIEKDSGDYHVMYYCYRPATMNGTQYFRERYDAQHRIVESWQNSINIHAGSYLTRTFYSGDTIVERTYQYNSDHPEEIHGRRSIKHTDILEQYSENISAPSYSIKKNDDSTLLADSLHQKTTWTYDMQHRINLIKEESWFNSDPKESREVRTMEIKYIERKKND